MYARALLLLSICLFVGTTSLRAQGKLAQVREKVFTSKDEPEDEDEHEDDHEHPVCWCEEDDDACSERSQSLSGDIFIHALLSPFIVPCLVIEDTHECQGYFPKFPYELENGYLQRESWTDDAPDYQSMRAWAGRFSIENGNDLDGLNRFNFHFQVETSSRFGIQSRWNFFHEDLDGCGCDQFMLGTTELTYRFAQSERFQMQAGIGFRVLDDRDQTAWGFNFTYGADVFPVKPMVISAVLDAGTVGSASVFHFRTSVGAIWNRFEVFGGYDYRNIGGVSLQGPLVGMRVWY